MKKIIIVIIVLMAVAVIACYLITLLCTKNRLYKSVQEIPYNEVGLLLGTSPSTKSGARNLFYTYRIDAAEALYKAGKIKFILISGDNSRKSYSEPDAMKKDLVKRGIPANRIYLDYAGFRTWDSVIRAKKIFGQTKMTVISQRFHNERSIFIGDRMGMELIGYNAKDVAFRWRRIRVYVREAFARVKIFMDIIVDKQPHFLGETIEIGEGKPQKDINY